MDQGMMHKVVQINLDPNEPQGCRVWGSVELQKIAGTIKIQAGGFGGMGGIPGLSGGLDAIMGMFMMPMMGMGAQIQDVRRFVICIDAIILSSLGKEGEFQPQNRPLFFWGSFKRPCLRT